MTECAHSGHRVYARRIFTNQTTHFCVQCLSCLRVVKMPEHGNRPFIRADEVPAGRKIHDFIESGDTQ